MNKYVIVVYVLSLLLLVLIIYYFFGGHSVGFVENISHITSSTSSMHTNVSIRIVVIVDNYCLNSSLECVWGLSVYIETNNTRFLFDTGPSPEVLLSNAERLGVNLGSMDFIVLSHEHMDHVGGLRLFKDIKPGLKVFIPSGSSLKDYVSSLGLEPVVVDRFMEIASGVYVSKPLYGPPWEIAIAVNTSYGLVVIVGCSHPGVDVFVEEFTKELDTKVYAVLGGFHLAGQPHSVVEEKMDKLVALGVSRIYPIHCSGDYTREYVMEKYSDKYGDGGAGLVIEIP